MRWPERPTCHGPSPQFSKAQIVWRPERMERTDDSDPYKYPFRACSYCGSIHPEDLIRFLGADIGVKLGGSDWKYGWPHKFYVEGIPNPAAGEKVAQYGYGGNAESWRDRYPHAKATDEANKFLLHYFDAPVSTHAKWYNEHILDDMDDEARVSLCGVLDLQAGVRFSVVDGRLKYLAPRPGYQR